jgi:hypothetical protein
MVHLPWHQLSTGTGAIHMGSFLPQRSCPARCLVGISFRVKFLLPKKRLMPTLAAPIERSRLQG